MREPTAGGGKAVPRLREGPATFFRLSPAEPGKAQCFAVKRGEAKQRFDPKFVLNGGHQTLGGTASYPLGSLVLREPEYGSGERAIPLQSADDIKYIRITDFNDDGIVPGNQFATVEKVEDRYRLLNGDILFARSGATAGKTFIYTPEIGPAIFAGYCIRFQFDANKALPSYIYFYTKTSRYQAWVRSIQRPSGQPNINKEEFKSFTVPLPALPVQQEMVDEIERARELRQRRLAEARALLSGLDGFLADRLGLTLPEEKAAEPDKVVCFAIKRGEIGSRLDARFNNPLLQKRPNAKYECMRIDEIAKTYNGGTPSKSVPSYWGGTVPWVTPKDFSDIMINDSEDHVTQTAVSETGLRVLQPGTVLVVYRSGVLSHSLPVAVGRTNLTINQDIKALLLSENVQPEYLVLYLHAQGKRLLPLITKHSTTVQSINSEQFNELLIPVPPLPVQQEMVEEMELRRLEAHCLQEEAGREWEEAKARFEARLLGAES